jgi:hypothetical protein
MRCEVITEKPMTMDEIKLRAVPITGLAELIPQAKKSDLFEEYR